MTDGCCIYLILVDLHCIWLSLLQLMFCSVLFLSHFLPVGSIIAPNYLDNSTSNVGPWCSCAASGNFRDQCNHFLSHFHDNNCLSE